MHQPFFSQGLSAFFERLTHGLSGDRVHHPRLDEPARKQVHAPDLAPLGRSRAPQSHQMRFGPAIELAGFATFCTARRTLLVPAPAAKRRRTLTTVFRCTPTVAAMAASLSPWALASKMRARWRSRRDRLFERAARSKAACSSTLRMTTCFFAGISQHLTTIYYLGKVLERILPTAGKQTFFSESVRPGGFSTAFLQERHLRLPLPQPGPPRAALYHPS